MTTMAAVMTVTLKPPSLLRSNRNSSRAAPTRAIQKQSSSTMGTAQAARQIRCGAWKMPASALASQAIEMS